MQSINRGAGTRCGQRLERRQRFEQTTGTLERAQDKRRRDKLGLTVVIHAGRDMILDFYHLFDLFGGDEERRYTVR